MRFRCIRTVEDHPGHIGRMRFVVRVGVASEPNDERLLELYGAPPLETVFPSAGDRTALSSGAGIVRPFESVDEALRFIDQVRQAVEQTTAYWERAEAFPGRED
jgi:hypothetical protein